MHTRSITCRMSVKFPGFIKFVSFWGFFGGWDDYIFYSCVLHWSIFSVTVASISPVQMVVFKGKRESETCSTTGQTHQSESESVKIKRHWQWQLTSTECQVTIRELDHTMQCLAFPFSAFTRNNWRSNYRKLGLHCWRTRILLLGLHSQWLCLWSLKSEMLPMM